MRLKAGPLLTPLVTVCAGVGLATAAGLLLAPQAWPAIAATELVLGVSLSASFLAMLRRQGRAHGLERSGHNLRAVIELLPDAVLIQKGGLIQYVNPAALALFGHARVDDLVGTGSIDLVHPEERDDVRRLRETPARPPQRMGQRRFLHRDGSTLWTEHAVMNVEFDGEPAIALVIRDVTARHRAEEALQRTEQSFRSLIEHIPLGILVLRDEKVVYANAAWLRMCRMQSADAILGRDAREIATDDERALIESRLAALSQGETPPPAEFRIRTEDGSTVRVESRPMRIDFDGKPCIVILARDIGPEREMQKRLMLSDRMVSIGTLSAGVAHEINNPLAYILANIDFSLETLRDPRAVHDASVRGDVTDALEQAREGASRVRTIVRDLKILSRRDEETVGPVELPRIVESSINMAFNEIRHRAKLVKQFGAVPRVLANEARLGQIFLNLLVNAAQAIPEGDAESNEIVVRTSTDEDGRAIVSVRDSGTGMTPETQRRIFDPFFTTKPIGVGTGLGLAICQSIAHSLSGEIQVESAPGKGSTFRLVLPPAHSDARRPDDAPAPPVKTRRGRVLVVDDEPMIGHAMHRLLGREHEVVALTRADAAMGKIDEGERFDVILCDLMMPDVTGMDFHGWLKERAPREANEVIFLTGGVFTERVAAFVSEVPNLRLEKPIDARKLRSVVNERIAGRPPG